ncbi:MAG: hypothetical protein ACTHOO_09520 [Alcanivorax sp.]
MNLDNLSPVFTGGTTQHAYDVHLLAQRSDGSLVDQQMNFSPAEAVYYRSHGMMRPLDVDKLADDGVLPNADRTATYYSFDDYAKTVTNDYNEAQKGAAELYNKIFDVVDPSRPDLKQVVVSDLDDRANMDWKTTDYIMQYAALGAENYMKENGFDPDMQSLIDQTELTRQLLANTGARIQEASVFSEQLNEPAPPGANFTQNDFSIDNYLGSVPTITSGAEVKV